ncbi:MAG: YdeI/OmpD-associated family protein [Ignavibacteriales bacterium]|nr:YdeI/OmpD-associated family protein [Ignavibacteriales bacterium]
MLNKDPRIDLYISRSADFAKPILIHIRELVHKACPDVEETIKWGFPHFEYKGPLCDMAAFKQHCSFGFWKAALMKDKTLIANAKSESAMGHYGKITSIKDLPSDKKIIVHITDAMILNQKGIKLPPRKIITAKKEIVVPDYFLKQLKKNKKAFTTFENFSPSHKREYIEWITEAKTDETKNRRMETAIVWMTEGKSRNWKYMK